MKKQILLSLIIIGLGLRMNAQWNGTNPVWTTSSVGIGTGYAGVGVISPVEKLTIGEMGGNFAVQDRRTSTTENYSSGYKFYDYYGESASILLEHNGYFGNHVRALKFLVNEKERLRIDSKGNIGIGTLSPLEKLHLMGNIITGNENGQQGGIYFGNNSHGIKRTDNNLNLYTHGPDGDLLFSTFLSQEKMRITANGNVGIGTATPRAKLDVVGDVYLNGGQTIQSYSPQLLLKRDTDYGGFTQGVQTQLVDGTNNWFFGNLHADSWIVSKGDYTGQKFTILSNGNVGVGTVDPKAKLDVVGDVYIDNLDWSTDTALRIREGSSNSYGAFFKYGLNDLLTIGTRDNNSDYVAIQIPRSSPNVTFNGSLNVSGSNSLNFSDHGGGFYMIDDEWIRTFGSKNFYQNTGIMRTDGSLQVGPNGDRFVVTPNGNVGVGTVAPDKKLTVKGTIHSSEVIVDTNFAPDYVFEKYYTGVSALKSDYRFPTLPEIENFTQKNNHLPGVPSAKEMQEKGISLGEMSTILLQKIEELTLYTIEQQKELEHLKKENENYKSLAERLAAIEKELKK